MNDYPGLEPNIPNYSNRIETFINLSEMLGKHRVIWRYDPFLTSSDPEYVMPNVIHRFKFMGDNINKYTNKLVFSFLDPYNKLPSVLNAPTKEEELQIVNAVIEANKTWKLQVATCAESVNNSAISVNRCIDPELLKQLGVSLDYPQQKDKSQREKCWCYPSMDIGTYHTCKHNCLYCYSR